MNKLKNTFIISFFITVTLFAVLLALLSIYAFTFGKENLLISSDETKGEVGVFADGIILGETEDRGVGYIDEIIFLGESTTYGLQRYGVLTGGTSTKQVWTGATVLNGKTVSAGTLSISPSIANTRIFYPDTSEALTVRQAVNIKKPKILVVTLGLNNGASYYTENEFKSCYRALLDSISESFSYTKVVLQSLFPVSENCAIKAYTPERISECNRWILDIAEEYSLNYLDTFKCLSDDSGHLKPEYDNGGDGIHLNKVGLMKVLEYIRTHGVDGGA